MFAKGCIGVEDSGSRRVILAKSRCGFYHVTSIFAYLVKGLFFGSIFLSVGSSCVLVASRCVPLEVLRLVQARSGCVWSWFSYV